MAVYGDLSVVVSDLTSNVVTDATTKIVTGDGIFDDLMETITAHIDAQYQLGRIKGDLYANVYLGAMQSALAESVRILMAKNITEKQAETEAAKTLLTEKQTDLVDRQLQGFDDDAKQKLFKIVMDAWSVGFSVSQTDIAVPDAIKVNVIDSIVKNLFDNYTIPVSVTTNPLGQ